MNIPFDISPEDLKILEEFNAFLHLASTAPRDEEGRYIISQDWYDFITGKTPDAPERKTI